MAMINYRLLTGPTQRITLHHVESHVEVVVAPTRPTKQISIRVHTDTLEHYEKLAESKGVPWSQEIRNTLSRGFECELGRCAWQVKAVAYLEELTSLRNEVSPKVEVHVAPWDVPGAGEALVVEDERAWLPPTLRHLTDKELVGRGYCLDHEKLRLECNGEHDDSV